MITSLENSTNANEVNALIFVTRVRVARRLEGLEQRIAHIEAQIDALAKSMGPMDGLFGRLPELDELRGSVAQIANAVMDVSFGLISGQLAPRQVASALPNADRELTHYEAIIRAMNTSYNRAKYGQV